MTIAEKIYERIVKMKEQKQREVLDFVEFLDSIEKKHNTDELEKNRQDFSLSNAMRGLEEDESPYSINDLKEVFS